MASFSPRRLFASGGSFGDSAGGFVGGALAGTGVGSAFGVADVGFVVGACAGAVAGSRVGGFVVGSAGAAVFVARLAVVQPALLVGVALVAAVAAIAGLRLAHARQVEARPVVVASVAASVAAVVYSVWGVTRHQRFGSGSWDYGCYLHNAWLFGHGKAFSLTAVSAVLGDVAFWGGTNHFMPSLVFTAPIDWLMEATSSTSLLLIAQAIVVAAAAIPLAALAQRRGLPLLTTTALVVAFLFHVGTQAALLFDVHEIAPVPLLLFAVLWIAETKAPTTTQKLVAALLLLLLAGTKESAVAYAAFVGLYLVVFCAGWRVFGAVAFVAFVAAFVVVVAVIQPALLEEGSKGMIHMARFGGDGSVSGVAVHALLHPGTTLASLISPDVKLTTIGTSAGGFGFLALGSGQALVLALPNLAERFLADKREMWGLGFHYGLVGAAFVAVGAVDTLTRLKPRLQRLHFDVTASVFVLGSLLVSCATSPSPPDLASFEKPYFATAAEVARYQRALAFVGDDDAVVAQNHFLPHLALREHIWLPEARFVDRADVVVVDTDASAWPKDLRFIRRLQESLARDPRFAVAFHEETTWVFRRRR